MNSNIANFLNKLKYQLDKKNIQHKKINDNNSMYITNIYQENIQINEEMELYINEEKFYNYNIKPLTKIYQQTINNINHHKIIINISSSFILNLNENIKGYTSLKLYINDTLFTVNEIGINNKEYRNLNLNYNVEIDENESYDINLILDGGIISESLLLEKPKIQSNYCSISISTYF